MMTSMIDTTCITPLWTVYSIKIVFTSWKKILVFFPKFVWFCTKKFKRQWTIGIKHNWLEIDKDKSSLLSCLMNIIYVQYKVIHCILQSILPRRIRRHSDTGLFLYNGHSFGDNSSHISRSHILYYKYLCIYMYYTKRKIKI